MVLEAFDQPLVLRDLPIPKAGEGEIVVRMKVCGVCGSDLKVQSGSLGTATLPIIPGHEIAGEVVELGPGVTDVKLGDRVVFFIYITCGTCRNCLDERQNICMNFITRPGFEQDGGMADYLVMPADKAVKIPDGVSYRHAAVSPDAVAVSVHAFYDRARPAPGDNVLIIGAGGLGLHGLQVAKALGAIVTVADIDDEKLEIAKRLGADHVINSKNEDLVEAAKALTGGYGMDIAGDYVGSPAVVELGLKCLRFGGKFLIVGYSPGKPFTADSYEIFAKELEILGSRAINKQNIVDALDLVKQGKVKPYIDEEFTLEQANEVLDRLKKGGFIGRGILIIDPSCE